MQELIAETDFSPDGSRRLKRGDSFVMSDNSARLLVATKKARYKTERIEPKKYKRRDMRPED